MRGRAKIIAGRAIRVGHYSLLKVVILLSSIVGSTTRTVVKIFDVETELIHLADYEKFSGAHNYLEYERIQIYYSSNNGCRYYY